MSQSLRGSCQERPLDGRFLAVGFGDWIWQRHQNMWSWYIRPLVLIPLAWFEQVLVSGASRTQPAGRGVPGVRAGLADR
jgi:hypothetical protein